MIPKTLGEKPKATNVQVVDLTGEREKAKVGGGKKHRTFLGRKEGKEGILAEHKVKQSCTRVAFFGANTSSVQ